MLATVALAVLAGFVERARRCVNLEQQSSDKA
jgi:hypothetical protein